MKEGRKKRRKNGWQGGREEGKDNMESPRSKAGRFDVLFLERMITVSSSHGRSRRVKGT
jgi:hypothetical protein